VLTLLSQKPLLSSGMFAQIVRPDELSTCDIDFISENFWEFNLVVGFYWKGLEKGLLCLDIILND
jgi:hypothetical protein